MINIRSRIQVILFPTAFLTYGVGDSLTAVYMMHIQGVGREANYLVRHIIDTQGFMAFVAFKIWLTLILLAVIYFMQSSSNERSYWTNTGFLCALTLGGGLAMTANLAAADGTYFPVAAIDILIIFMVLAIGLASVGSVIDARIYGKNRFNRDFTIDGHLYNPNINHSVKDK